MSPHASSQPKPGRTFDGPKLLLYLTDMFDIIADQRNRIADQLEALDADQWQQPSLCGEWTVQQVAAHLTTGWNVSLPRFGLAVLKARGDFHRANNQLACTLAERSPAEIVADLRANAAHQFTPPGAGAEAPLADCIVHARDMFEPLDIDYPVDPNTTVKVMSMVTEPKAKRATGTTVAQDYSLRATDITWTHENAGKQEIEAPVLELLLAIFGRRDPASL